MKIHDHGFILHIFNKIINIINKLNIVEHVKDLSIKIVKPKDISDVRRIKRTSIDVFIVCKWLLIFILWGLRLDNLFLVIITFYLLFMNIHTYFYYHLWEDKAIYEIHESKERLQGRFLSLMQAFFYTVFSFAYLYAIPFKDSFDLKEGFCRDISAISLSLGNSLGGSTDVYFPNDTVSLILTGTQVFITFIFLAILLGRSLPIFSQGGNKDGIQK